MQQDSLPVGLRTADNAAPAGFLTIARISGEPDALLRGYRQTSGVMAEVGRDHGLILHAAAQTDEGLLIVNLWPSQGSSEAAAGDARRRDVVRHHRLASDQLRHEHHHLADHVIFNASGRPDALGPAGE